MRTEFLKVRSLPTPLWTGLALLLCFVGGLAASVIWGVGEDNASLEVAVNFPLWIASMVLGVWIAGVEFGQNTMRRVLAADPRRIHLIFSKLAVVLLIIVAATVALDLVGALLYGLAGSGHTYSIDSELALRSGAATVLSNLIAAAVGMSLTLLTRSMAGGLTITLVFFFVLDSVLSLIPKVGHYTLGAASGDLTVAISGSTNGNFGEAANLHPATAALVTVAWIVLLFGAGAYRTLQTDVK